MIAEIGWGLEGGFKICVYIVQAIRNFAWAHSECSLSAEPCLPVLWKRNKVKNVSTSNSFSISLKRLFMRPFFDANLKRWAYKYQGQYNHYKESCSLALILLCWPTSTNPQSVSPPINTCLQKKDSISVQDIINFHSFQSFLEAVKKPIS